MAQIGNWVNTKRQVVLVGGIVGDFLQRFVDFGSRRIQISERQALSKSGLLREPEQPRSERDVFDRQADGLEERDVLRQGTARLAAGDDVGQFVHQRPIGDSRFDRGNEVAGF